MYLVLCRQAGYVSSIVQAGRQAIYLVLCRQAGYVSSIVQAGRQAMYLVLRRQLGTVKPVSGMANIFTCKAHHVQTISTHKTLGYKHL